MSVTNTFFPRVASTTAIIASVFLLSACLADIRPPEIQKAVPGDAARKGRTLLNEAMGAHGGLATWKKHGTTEVVLTDTWPGWLMRTIFMPWSRNTQLMKLLIRNGTDISRLEFLDGPAKGRVWGIQYWATYRAKPGGKPVFKDDEEVKFWLPTMEYFVELPFRLREANIALYAGERKLDGKTFDLVYLTWGKQEAQKMVDQYVVWINRETKLIEWVRYTVRDYGGFVTSYMQYSDFRDVGGIKIGFNMRTTDKAGAKNTGHQFLIKSLKFGVSIPDNVLVPEPNRRGAKY